MNRLITAIFSVVLLAAVSCNNGGVEEKDPSITHPPSEAIPESTKLVNDSVIVPDTTPGNGKQVGNSDSIHQNKH